MLPAGAHSPDVQPFICLSSFVGKGKVNFCAKTRQMQVSVAAQAADGTTRSWHPSLSCSLSYLWLWHGTIMSLIVIYKAFLWLGLLRDVMDGADIGIIKEKLLGNLKTKKTH